MQHVDTYICAKGEGKCKHLFSVKWEGIGIIIAGMWYEKMSISKIPSYVIDPETSNRLEDMINDHVIIIRYNQSHEQQYCCVFTKNWLVRKQDGSYSITGLQANMFDQYCV